MAILVISLAVLALAEYNGDSLERPVAAEAVAPVAPILMSSRDPGGLICPATPPAVHTITAEDVTRVEAETLCYAQRRLHCAAQTAMHCSADVGRVSGCRDVARVDGFWIASDITCTAGVEWSR